MASKGLRVVLASALLLGAGAAMSQGQPMLRAAEVARADFVGHLARRNDGDWEFARYVANIDNYNIGISASRDCYVVVFLLNDPKHEIDGGGAEYRIDKRTLKIVHVMGYK